MKWEHLKMNGKKGEEADFRRTSSQVQDWISLPFLAFKTKEGREVGTVLERKDVNRDGDEDQDNDQTLASGKYKTCSLLINLLLFFNS